MFCPMCQKIVNIRQQQGKEFIGDLCWKCRKRYFNKQKQKKLAKQLSSC